MLTDFSKPFVFSDLQDAYHEGPQALAALGVPTVSFQAQNGGNEPKDFDLAHWRQAGTAGVWGVTYAVDDANNNPRKLSFHEQNRILGLQAVKLGADHVIVDAEDCAKGTRRSRGLQVVILALREAGWKGPVSLSTLGAPDNPKTATRPDGNDYEIDTQSFLETGGFIIPQAYGNENDGYMPHICEKYWLACGVPRTRLNLTIGFHPAGSGTRKPGTRWAGSVWKALLEETTVMPAWSGFLSYQGTRADYEALKPLLLSAAAPDPAWIKSEMARVGQAMTDHWTRNGMSKASLLRQRIGAARQILVMSDSRWFAVRDKVGELIS